MGGIIVINTTNLTYHIGIEGSTFSQQKDLRSAKESILYDIDKFVLVLDFIDCPPRTRGQGDRHGLEWTPSSQCVLPRGTPEDVCWIFCA